MILHFSANNTISVLSGQILGKRVQLSMLLLFCSSFMFLYSQERVQVSQPSVSFTNNRLIIKYDILGSQPEDVFLVEMEIIDSTGARIDAKSVYGDIGEKVTGSANKQIIWDLAADEIYLNRGISIELFATRKVKPQIAENGESDDAEKEEISHDITRENLSSDSQYTGSFQFLPVMIQSTLVPGLGLSRMSNNKSFWIMGIAGYGCLASSIYFNRMASSNYDNYLSSFNPEEFTSYFEKGQSQYKTAKILGWAAVAIWVADLGLTWMQYSKLKGIDNNRKAGSFSLGTTYNHVTSTQALTVYYNF